MSINCPDNAYVINKLIKTCKFKHGAELGVRRGEFSTYLLQENPDLIMSCVDIWGQSNALNERHNHDVNYGSYKHNTFPYKDRVKEYKMLMSEGAKLHEFESLDFIFIDGTHTYKAVKEDLENWVPNVNSNGIICGHDYNEAFDNGGVIKAVKELCPDIIEFVNTSSIDVNNEKVFECLNTSLFKGVADRANGCWYIWKN